MASYQYIFSLENLSKTWSGGKTLFENINLSFLPNAKIGIVGINGSGKSTFLKILIIFIEFSLDFNPTLSIASTKFFDDPSSIGTSSVSISIIALSIFFP